MAVLESSTLLGLSVPIGLIYHSVYPESSDTSELDDRQS